MRGTYVRSSTVSKHTEDNPPTVIISSKNLHVDAQRDGKLVGDLEAGLAQIEMLHDHEAQRGRQVVALASHLEQISALRPADPGV